MRCRCPIRYELQGRAVKRIRVRLTRRQDQPLASRGRVLRKG